MDYQKFQTPLVSNKEIKKRADQFRKKYWGDIIPVNIETILEQKLGIEIIPIPGELGHMDCLYLSKENRSQLGLKSKEGFLVGLEDDCTRLAYTEYITDIKARTVNFFLYRALSWFKQNTGIEFESIMTDNGSEFTTHHKEDRKKHIFEQSLEEIGIKHKYTQPYHPQTNGKIEAFWKIARNSFLKNRFSDLDNFKERLGNYINDYNLYRKHGGLNYLTPFEKFKIVTELLD